MFSWIATVLRPPVADSAMEEAAAAWLGSGMQGKPPAGATTSEAFIRYMRARFKPLREKASESDPTVKRRYGVV
jgi:hypothetical protein